MVCPQIDLLCGLIVTLVTLVFEFIIATVFLRTGKKERAEKVKNVLNSSESVSSVSV